VGEVLVITGSGFGLERVDTSFVSFDETKATEYLSWTDTRIEVRIPVGISGVVKVTVTAAAGVSRVYDLEIAATSVEPGPADGAPDTTRTGR
jgi:hypothetical protein